MYKSKKEVDAHVRNVLSRLRSEADRNIRGYTIAKLYYKINEYASAEQHLNAYLSVKEDNSEAHKLLGQCFQRTKKPDKALQSFQRSLQLNAKQPDVLIEVCKLLLDSEAEFNVGKAKYWCDLAESEKIKDDAVFTLRLKLMNKLNADTDKVEEMLQKEITARPQDVQLRVRLLRNYIEQTRVLDAFKYVHNIEMTQSEPFSSSIEWYNAVWLVLTKYEQQPNIKRDWEFWLLLIICLERQVFLSFTVNSGSISGGVTETGQMLFQLDQHLYKVSQVAGKLSAQKELVALFLDHYRGQFLLYAAALIFKRELVQNKNKWKESVKLTLPLLLLAYRIQAVDSKEPWMKHCDEQGVQLIQMWNREGAFRCAQAGRTLLSCIADESQDKENAGMLQLNQMVGDQGSLWTSCEAVLAQIRQTCSDKQWRRSLFAVLFSSSDQKLNEQTSLLVKCSKLGEPTYEMPSFADVERYEESAQYLRPQSLAHIVYLSLGNDNLAHVRAKYFSGLNFSTQNLSFCGAESLNQLDVDTFLYAATIQAKRANEVELEAFHSYNSGNRNACGRPRQLPFVNVQPHLCSEEQAGWWDAAYRVYKNLASDSLSELRSTLQYGIEAVRGINGPKVDMAIVFRVGRLLATRAQDVVKPVERSHLESRVESLYKYGLNMLKMHNKGVLEPFRKYFKYVKSNTSAVDREIRAAAEDAVSYLAPRYFKKSQYEELVDELSGVQLPFATYMQAEAYRKLDASSKTPLKTKRLYLDKASECLNQTLMLLQNTQVDANHPLNSVIHSEIKLIHQASAKYLNESGSPMVSSGAHNNSSTYEDAEEDAFFLNSSPAFLPASVGQLNRSRRDSLSATAAISAANSAAAAAKSNSELESLVRQMATTLTLVKDELVDAIKPEMLSMRKEIASLKDKMAQMEDQLKRTRHNTATPTREDVLDDLYLIDDALSNQLYGNQGVGQQSGATGGVQSHLAAAGGPNIFSSTLNGNLYQQQQQQSAGQQQRIHTPNHLQMQNAAVAAAAAYGSPMFNPMNYYATSPYMMAQQAAAAAGVAGSAMMGGRGGLPGMPYMEATGLNYNMPQAAAASLLPQGLNQTDGRTSNLYGLLTQPQQQPQQQQQQQQPSMLQPSGQQSQYAPQLPAMLNAPPMASLPQAQPPSNTAPVTQFNKTLNNQPVEKGPPANVVITSSDPLPNPNSTPLTSNQRTLSVTIPSHHIKPSLVQTPEQVAPPANATANVFGGGAAAAGGFGGFGAPTTSSFGGFGFSVSSSGVTAPVVSSSTTSSSSLLPGTTSVFSSAPAVSSSISSTTFTFKPQVLQAQQAKKEELAAEAASLDKTTDSVGSVEHNKSGGGDNEPEYDPRPDFKPIIPLPDEIEVRTGEEDEDVMFSHRAKLFRLVNKDWKERGIGDIKILKSRADGSSRVVMRRDQTHKICANHKITPMTVLTEKSSNGCIWVADDFADEQLHKESFFVRFKLPETMHQFRDAFHQAHKEAEQAAGQEESEQQQQQQQPPAKESEKPAPVAQFGLAKSAITTFATSTPSQKADTKPLVAPTLVNATAPVAAPTSSVATAPSAGKSLFGGLNLAPSKPADAGKSGETTTQSPFSTFTFGSAATANPESPISNLLSNLNKPAAASSPFSAPLAAFSSPAPAPSGGDPNKSTASDGEDEYVPTAQFNPVIPLPELVEVSTGEENELVLFEYRAKLFRFVKELGEWKERGLGNIKLLQDKDNVNLVRLVMRREQVHKLCCNQRLLKSTSFKYVKNMTTALCWGGKDFSENELVTEMFMIRFKTAETCAEFLEAIQKAQAAMTEEGDDGEAAGDAKAVSSSQPNEAAKKAAEEDKPKGFGDAFKPKAGSWSCEACYITNTGDTLYCVACDSPKDSTVPKKGAVTSTAPSTQMKFTFGFGAAGAATAPATAPQASKEAAPALIFGKPTTAKADSTVSSTTTATVAATSTTPAATKGFGDQFKAKAGSWSCEACYLSNTADVLYCTACEAPKDSTVPKKGSSLGGGTALNLSSTAPKFSFGFNAAGGPAAGAAGDKAGQFSFGLPQTTKSEPVFGGALATAQGTDASKSFTFAPPTATSTQLDVNAGQNTLGSLSKPAFSFSLKSSAKEAPAPGAASNTFSLDKKDFSFTLKPKSPGKVGKSPLKLGGAGEADDGDDGDDVEEEEENNTYFTPVIPLPDKVDVKTGEEDEDVLYVHRAKLYRFVEGEWKERGLGDVKILRHKASKSLRVVMRREQILKICLNHVLNDEVKYTPKDEKSWLFYANDFSEGVMASEKFSLRFKNKEIAQEFLEAVNRARDGTAEPIPIPSGETRSGEAAKLLLPPDFYEQKAQCPGCRGCDPDAFEFAPTSAQTFVGGEDGVKPSLPLELPALVVPKAAAAANRSLLKESLFSSPQAAADTTFTGFGGGAKPNAFAAIGADGGDKSASNVTFSFAAAFNSTAKEEAKEKAPAAGEGGGFLFGSAANANATSTIFGGGGDKKPVFGQAPSLFGGANKSDTSAAGSDGATNNLFGGTGKTIFGGKPTFGETPSIFGSLGGKSETAATNGTGGQSIFGSSAANSTLTSGASNSIFGASTFGNTTTMQTSIFGSTTGGGNLFGQKPAAANDTKPALGSGGLFGNTTAGSGLNSTAGGGFADLSAKAGTVDFASLAAKASTGAPKANEKPGLGGFIGLTNQQDAFSSFNKGSKLNESTKNDSARSNDGEAADDDNYDPHYEPIIALPNEISVVTGEEDEKKLFGERAVLFRYDSVNKEWKERGVGELKILQHPEKGTYRLLMRREQVHKLVLNHFIGADFKFSSLNNNPKSFCWATMNFAENNDGVLEKLAVRFKKVELAEEFSKTLNTCLEALEQQQQQ